MGMMHHHAVIATTWNGKSVRKIKKWIKEQERKDLFVVGKMQQNAYITVIMTVDGSKEGWKLSAICDKLRGEFIAELKKEDYDDGSNPWSYVEVGFGELGQEIISGNNIMRY